MPRPQTAPPAAPVPAPPAEAAPPAPAAPQATSRATMTTPQTKEVAPASPYLPLTPAQRKTLDKSFFVGRDNYGTEMAQEAINRSAVSKPGPPLSAAEREKLQKELHTGENDAAGGAGKEKLIRAAALSKRTARLTAEEWDRLTKVYRTGRALYVEEMANEAIRRGALSLRIALADQQKALEAMYNVGRPARLIIGPLPYGRTEARLISQTTPELPAEFADRAFDFTVVARFLVATDGSAEQVLLTEPTPEPYFNQALVVALEKWRFYPAVDSGKPVASTVEIRFTISAPAGDDKAPKKR